MLKRCCWRNIHQQSWKKCVFSLKFKWSKTLCTNTVRDVKDNQETKRKEDGIWFVWSNLQTIKMPIQTPQWTEYLSCPVCENGFELKIRLPISLGCGHTICKTCLSNLQRSQCPFDLVSQWKINWRCKIKRLYSAWQLLMIFIF